MNKTDNGAQVAAEHGIARSPHWATVQQAYKKVHPDCIYCGPGSGQKYGIQIHHIHAFHVVVGVGRSDLELDFRNLTSLCESEENKPAPNHHISEGHLGSFQRNNDTVVEDVKKFFGQAIQLIEATDYWKNKKNSAPKAFSTWTHDEKVAYRKMLDATLPPDSAVLAKFFPNGLPIVNF
jgi:hypothetical protein